MTNQIGDVEFEIMMAVAELDCEISGTLRDGEGKFCIVGGLYACIDPDWAQTGKKGVDKSVDEYAVVREAFGVETNKLVKANDGGSERVAHRRARVRTELRRQYASNR
jgi:hypothetical protein